MDDTPGRLKDDVTRRPSVDDLNDVAGNTEERTRGYATAENEPVGERTHELRHEIEETRGEMTSTIEAIQEKLKPSHIVADATERVKSATTERVREMADTASEKAQDAMDYTRDAANRVAGSARQNTIPLALIGVGAAWLLTRRSNRERNDRDLYRRSAGWRDADEESSRMANRYRFDDDDQSGFIGRIRNNPIPAAMAGIGLGWLAFANNDRDGDYYRSGNTAYSDRWSNRGVRGSETSQYGASSEGMAERLTDSAGQLASRTREYASDTADSMRRMARRRQNQLQRMINENPLLVGAGALLLGAAFGLAVPETEAENEWMGEARDNVVGRARDMARDAVNQVQDAAGTVADAAKKLTGKS